MSTKTSFKRIALVAASALAIAGFSAVPANATTTAVTTVLGTITPADGSAAVGGLVSIPLNLTTGTIDADTTWTATATFAQSPVNTALTNASITATATGNAAEFTGPAADNVLAATATANAIAYTTNGTAAAITNKRAGTFTFTPDVPGLYLVTIAIPAGTNTGTITATATAGITIIVGGAQATQATSGKGTATATATTGGSAVVFYQIPGATTAASRFNITSSGVGAISNIQDCANDDATMVKAATVVRCAAGGSTTEDFINGVNSSDGLFFINTTLAAGNVLTGPSAQGSVTFDAASNVAGTQTVTITNVDLATGAPTVVATVTLTWGAAPVLSTGLSTAFICAGSAGTCAADAVVSSTLTAQTAAANAAASIEVITRNSAGASLVATQTISATISGPGTLSIGTTNNVASAGRALTGVAGNDLILVFGDGTSGKSTITISQGTTVIATKTLNFFGAVATLTAVQNHRIASSAGAALGSAAANAAATSIATTPAVVITAKDALGSLVPGLTVTALSSDTTVMSNTIAINGVTATPGTYNVQVNSVAKASGSTATLTFRVMSGTTVVAATAPVTYTLGGAVDTVALSLDADSYTIGAPAVATITVKDSSGNAAFDADHANIMSNANGLFSSLAITKTLFGATAVPTLGGVATVSFNAPSVAAEWTISGTTGAGPATDIAKALSASATVDVSEGTSLALDAANAATDAANNAYDEAQNATQAASDALAAVTALAKQVKSLIASVKKLTKSVAKLS